MANLNFLKHNWDKAIRVYCTNTVLSDHEFNKVIVPAHTEEGRHYHNLNHLEHLLRIIASELDDRQDIPTLAFIIFYHDIVYKALEKNNEQRSAEIASESLAELGVPTEVIEHVTTTIMATANHMKINDGESATTQLFLDADLAILGTNKERYIQYMEEVRLEYKIVPSILYNSGRRKVLKRFLEEPYLYRTASFRTSFEEKARDNIRFEIDSLG